MQDAVGQDYIYCGAEAFNDLDLEHCTLELRQVHEAVAHALLSEVHEQQDHVGYALASDSRRWHQRDIPCEIFVLVVEHRIESLLGESQNSLLHSVFEFTLDGVFLLG